jgi:hypothetical protein
LLVGLTKHDAMLAERGRDVDMPVLLLPGRFWASTARDSLGWRVSQVR